MQVSAYKSPKKDELYLYIPQSTKIEDLANELLVMFGEPQHVIDFELTADRKLPRVDAQALMDALDKQGYFIQMPPSEIEKISDMPAPPAHLDNIF